MWAVMKCEGWTARRGRSDLTEKSRAAGGVLGSADVRLHETLGADSVGWVEGGAGEEMGAPEASMLAVSSFFVVERYRARLGRRKVGGSTDMGILRSKDFLIVLLSIVKLCG